MDRQIDNHMDDHVDEEIKACINLENPSCFFTCAGAGSGKTSSLIKALQYIEDMYSDYLNIHCKKVAVITYTNAAVDEINSRLQNNKLFSVSTIHSFLWELVKNYQKDIKDWIAINTEQELKELEEKERKGRPGTAASNDRIRKKHSYTNRLEKLKTTHRVTYNPNGTNIGYESLSHAEVIKIGSDFIMQKKLMQKILVAKFPIVLIDECQDTKKELIDALLALYHEFKDQVIIGMFGDTMQRVYTDGKDNLEMCLPTEWVRPQKEMNHRSSQRVIGLANSIRQEADNVKQFPRTDAKEGIVRMFVVPRGENKEKIERQVSQKMVEVTGDSEWEKDYKGLILEHHMAGNRMGFIDLYSPLYENSHFKQGILDGTIPELKLFLSEIIPLANAIKNQKKFEIMKILRKISPILSANNYKEHIENQRDCLKKANQVVTCLTGLWEEENIPTCLDVLKNIRSTGLIELTDRLDRVIAYDGVSEDVEEEVVSLYKAFDVPFSAVEAYGNYISEQSPFATHQGVKGLEFPRVMVIIDDEEAKGFMFSYDKLFGEKERTEADIQNENAGKDSSISRTRRLFYVACTRAKESLAVVVYSGNPDQVKNTFVQRGWFKESEVYVL